ncbi:hypothetical protein LXA43DRAFT_1088056 [Ganoderma leucocontextum]|nr:hypothetical protein LXA43DRAFT_1088056 [Ganoderma leucocontextum]
MTNDTGSTTRRKAQEPEPTASSGSSQQPTGKSATGKSTTTGSAPQQSPQRIEFQSGGSETLPGSSDNSTPEQQPITQPESHANLEITRACESLIDAYKRGQQLRVTTLLSLAKALGVESAENDDGAALQAFDSYYAQVQEIDDYRKESQQPTKSREQSQHRPEAGEGERGRTQTLGEPKGKERADRERSRSPARRTPRKLDGYYLHIFSLFSAVHTSHHACILEYDRAVRKRVAAKRTLLLTDSHEFRDLHVQFIDTFGASASGKNTEEGKKRGGSARKPRDEEACRRWNRGICDITDGTCKYVHRCTSCSATDHPATRCSKNPKRKT